MSALRAPNELVGPGALASHAPTLTFASTSPAPQHEHRGDESGPKLCLDEAKSGMLLLSLHVVESGMFEQPFMVCEGLKNCTEL